MSVKNKTLIFISFVLILFSVATLTIISFEQKKEMKLVQQECFSEIQNLYNKINNKYENFYRNKTLVNSVSFDIHEAIIKKDKESLYKLFEKKYKTLKKENADLIMMNFHLLDNSTLLKMSAPKESYEKNIRSVVKKVYKKNKDFISFSKYENKVIYSVIYPIFYNEQYIGAMELGIDINYILAEMKYYLDIKSVLTMGDDNNLNNDNTNIKTINNISYASYTINIKNNKNRTIAKIEFLKNITNNINHLEKNKVNILTYMSFLTILTIIIINIGFNRSIKNLENSFCDVSEYKQMIDEHVMVINTNTKGKILSLSNRLSETSGYQQSELIGQSVEMIRDPNSLNVTCDAIATSLKNKGYWHGELKNLTKTGFKYWTQTTIQAVIKDNVVLSHNYIMHDITEKKMNEELMLIDGLTNIYNRRHFNEIFPRMAKNIKRDGGCFNFIILDVDNFKAYNDTYGHPQGDIALKAIADVLQNSLHRPSDFCFRLGGEEFGVLYKTANEDEGYLFAQKLRKNVEMLNIEHNGNMIHKVLTASFGLVSLMREHMIDEKEIYTMADEHLYRAKEDGRNKVVSKLV